MPDELVKTCCCSLLNVTVDPCRAATNNFNIDSSVHYFMYSQILCSVYKMSEKCRSVFPKAQDDVLECLILSTSQRYSVCYHRLITAELDFNVNYR